MSLYDLAKDAAKLAQKADNVELLQKLLDVQRQALDMQEELQTAKQEVLALRQENKELQNSFNKVGVVEYQNEAYWERVGEDDWRGPNCSACWLNKQKLMPLTRRNVGSVNYSCPSCKANYGWEVSSKYKSTPKDKQPKVEVSHG